MSKAILGIGLLIVAVAAPFLAPAALGLAAGSFAAIAAVTAIEVGVALTQSLLLGPGKLNLPNTQATSRLYATLETVAPRKFLLGSTAGANDVRYQSYTGSNQDTYWQVIVLASHQINAIKEIWFDNEQAYGGGSVLGRYVGFLTVTTRTLGSSSNGVPIDSTWTSACTLTGCAYLVLSFKLSDNGSTKSPFASGVTRRITTRCDGALVYDPRLDSTVTGGSGSQRAGTQSTWAWDANGSNNPALQLLWYLLGWQINGKLAVGMGIPPARIDLPSFITAANHCDESVSLTGGGTEPRYRTKGVMSEADSRKSVIDMLCACMNATLRDAGGKLSLSVVVNDLSTPITPSGRSAFDEGDVLGGEDWQQTPDLHEMFNIVRGRRIDPSNNALYQPVDFPEQSITSLDGIDRIQTVDYLLVESNGQAQRLAATRLQRAQYQGRYSFTGGAAWWQVSIGDVVQMSHAGLGWSSKLFRMVGQAIARNGQTKVTLLEENSAIYAWSGDVAGTTAGTPTVLDPNNTRIGGIQQGATSNIPRGVFAASTAYAVNDMVYSAGTLYICILAYTSTSTLPSADTTHWAKYSSGTLDDLSDGSTYQRMPGSNMDSNRRGLVDFTQSGHLSKNLDNIGDGSTYGRGLLARYNAGRPWVDFSEAIHANQGLVNNSNVPLGHNLVVNSEMGLIDPNLSTTYPLGFGSAWLGNNSPQPSVADAVVTLADGSYALGRTCTGSMTSGNSVDGLTQDFTYFRRFQIPVKSGDTIALSARIAHQGCSGAFVEAQFQDETGAYSGELGGSTSAYDIGAAAFTSVSRKDMALATAIIVVPADGGAGTSGTGRVRWARLNVRFTSNGTSNPRLLVAAPFLAKVNTNQTATPLYSPGPADRVATYGAYIGPGGNVSGAVDANLRPYIDFTQGGHLSKNLDNIGDGSTYGRPILTRLSSGKPLIDFAEAIHLNKNIDNVSDGSTYARVLAAGMSGGQIARNGLYSRTQGSQNLLFNPIGRMGLQGWTASVGSVFSSQNYGTGFNGRFAASGATASNLEQTFTSVNAQYVVSGYIEISSGGGTIGVEIVDKTTNTVLASQYVAGYFSITASCPSTTDTYAVRLKYAPASSGNAYWYQIKLELGTIASAFSDDAATSLIPLTHNPAGGSGLDGLLDGSTYGRPILSRLSSGKPLIDFAEAIHLNKNVDNIADGSTYGRTLASRLSSGNPLIDFSAGYHLNKNLDNVADGSTYGSLPLANISGSGASKRALIDFSQGSHKFYGSVPPSCMNNWFGYSMGTTSGSITWNAATIYRADGSAISISSGSYSITGLSAGTSYKVYPYIVDNGGSSASIAFVTGGTGTGSPAACYTYVGDAVAAITMNAPGHIPLNSFQITTPSSGTGSGTGGGSLCLHPLMLVGNKVAQELEVGERVPTPDGSAPIKLLQRREQSEWIVVYAAGGVEIARVTPEHRFHRANGEEVRANELKLGMLLAAAGDHIEVTGLELDTEVAELVSIELPPPHLYYAGCANLLCHNLKP